MPGPKSGIEFSEDAEIPGTESLAEGASTGAACFPSDARLTHGREVWTFIGDAPAAVSVPANVAEGFAKSRPHSLSTAFY